jgi:phosphate:Na+ symporter
MNAELVESHRLALSVFLRGDRADAQLLIERKRRLLQLEADATALSVQMLREAAAASRAAGTDTVGAAAEESGLLLRIVRDLRRVHSHLASFAYPVVRRQQRAVDAGTEDEDAAGRG